MVETAERIEESPYYGNGRVSGNGLHLLPGQSVYSLDYLPLTYALGNTPQTPLQDTAFEHLQEYIHGPELKGSIYELPRKGTPTSARPRIVIMFGNGELGCRTDSLGIHRAAGNPPPTFLFINSVPHLPSHIDLTAARTQIVEAGTHCGVILEGDRKIQRAIWISTQGNWYLLEGEQEEILQNIAWRSQEHFGSPKLSTRHDADKNGFTLPWRVLANSPAFANTSEAAHILGDMGIIENEVDLTRFTADARRAKLLAKAFNKNGVGESMRSEYDPAGFLAITRSGGGKIEVDPDPKKGHLTPVSAITPDGYIIPHVSHMPKFSKLRITNFANGSVETHENVLLAIARTLAIQGYNIEQVLQFAQNRFSEGDKFIPIQLEDSPQLDRFAVDHAHWHTAEHAGYIKIGHPDYRYFPKRDFACGTMHAAWAMISGFMDLDEFHDPEGLIKNVLGVELPGHGYVFMAEGPEGRRRLTQAITADSKLVPPERA